MTLDGASDVMVTQCMAVQSGEDVLIIVDAKSRRIGESLFRACVGIGAEAALVEIKERTFHGEEPPAPVAAAMIASSVIIAPTTMSISHTQARRSASAAGARVLTMPGITEDLMVRAMGSDYRSVGRLTAFLASELRDARVVRVVAPGGTDITMSVHGRKCHEDTGELHLPGSFGNLPAGEAYVSPVEGSSNGTIVIDGALAGIERLDAPVVVTVEDGMATGIGGGEAASRFRAMLEGAQDPAAWNLAELGIGTNESVTLSGNALEVEKVLGTIHFGFGDNVSMGGQVKAPIHVDGVILRPTLIVDGRVLIRDGEIMEGRE